MFEQRFAVVGHQNQWLLAEIGAGGRIKPLAQADQVTFLDVEQGFTVDQGVQQTAFEQIELSSANVFVEVVYCSQFDRLAAWLESFEQKFRDTLKRADELFGVRGLVTYQIHG
eukprot:TRINITY_DN4791_c0_g2_i1.p2 TRINITY_DN4791_c0_g2~~TRINITY_DN4791_c0_g2_i1.p2  ORF type:complete len:113 (-),score=5.44 TRINITY_DN4791_c0_g2_i1:188-526(-)